MLRNESAPHPWIGKTILTGLTWQNEQNQVTGQQQIYGTITWIDENKHTLEVEQADGDIWTLPFYTETIRQIPPRGKYKLSSNGEEVHNPDLLMSWRVIQTEEGQDLSWQPNTLLFSEPVKPREWEFTAENDIEFLRKDVVQREHLFIGKHVLVGIRYYEKTEDDPKSKFIRQEQLHGEIVRANPADGIVIRQANGEEFNLPPDLTRLEPSSEVDYKLRSTGEMVVNPDYIATWVIEQKPNEQSNDENWITGKPTHLGLFKSSPRFSYLLPEINSLIQQLQSGIQSVLGDQLVGLYLEGSLAAGGFDSASDIDFTAVTQADVTPEQFTALQAMHDRLQQLDTPWAIQLEGMYISRAFVRRYDPAEPDFPNLERGLGERLKLVRYDQTGVIHRWIIREHGIALLGPPPNELIDPVSPDDLRQASRAILRGWGGGVPDITAALPQEGYQAYFVLSICRVLYTIDHGAVVPKGTAASWAEYALPERWRPLIERAWITRRRAEQGQTSPAEIGATLEFLTWAVGEGK